MKKLYHDLLNVWKNISALNDQQYWYAVKPMKPTNKQVNIKNSQGENVIAYDL